MKNENQDVKLALEEMRFSMEQILSSGGELDQKANIVLAAAGIIIVVATTLQIPPSSTNSNLYWFLLALAVTLYLAAIVTLLFSASPKAYHHAISANWEELDKQLFEKSERDAILNLLSGYVAQIHHNENINKQKAKMYNFSLIVLLVTVIIFVLSISFQ